MNNSAPQEKFDKTYITSSEICKLLQVSRPAIHFRRTAGKLPGAINVFGQQLLIWERDKIQPHLQEWLNALKERRSTE